MYSFLKINSTNLVSNGLNNSWRYDFVGSSVNFQDVEVAIQSISEHPIQYRFRCFCEHKFQTRGSNWSNRFNSECVAT